jgi:hypothetical protein
MVAGAPHPPPVPHWRSGQRIPHRGLVSNQHGLRRSRHLYVVGPGARSGLERFGVVGSIDAGDPGPRVIQCEWSFVSNGQAMPGCFRPSSPHHGRLDNVAEPVRAAPGRVLRSADGLYRSWFG